MITIKTNQEGYGNTTEKVSLNDAGEHDDFFRNTTSFEYKQKATDSIGNNSIKAVKIMVPSKYLSNFWRTPELQ